MRVAWKIEFSCARSGHSNETHGSLQIKRFFKFVPPPQKNRNLFVCVCLPPPSSWLMSDVYTGRGSPTGTPLPERYTISPSNNLSFYFIYFFDWIGTWTTYFPPPRSHFPQKIVDHFWSRDANQKRRWQIELCVFQQACSAWQVETGVQQKK